MHIVVVGAGQTIEVVTAHLKPKLLSFVRPGGSSFTPRDETQRSQVAGIALHRRTAEVVTVQTGANALPENAPDAHVAAVGPDHAPVTATFGL